MNQVCAIATAVLIGACGGKPVGSNVPRANPAHVAGVAAAAAAALTLANPDLVGRVPEDDRPGRVRGSSGSRETVPESVLDRADAAAAADVVDAANAAPCKPDSKAEPEGEAPPLDLTVPDHWTAPAAPAEPPPCKPPHEEEADGSATPSSPD